MYLTTAYLALRPGRAEPGEDELKALVVTAAHQLGAEVEHVHVVVGDTTYLEFALFLQTVGQSEADVLGARIVARIARLLD